MIAPMPFTDAGWRAFRPWLARIAADALIEIRTDAEIESCTRIEREQRIERLFFTSHPAEDLAAACACMESEVQVRWAEHTQMAARQATRLIETGGAL